jgi:IS5 family transposase
MIEHSRGFPTSGAPTSYFKGDYGWDRTRLDTRQGAAIWCRHGAFTHNLVKIGALTS